MKIILLSLMLLAGCSSKLDVKNIYNLDTSNDSMEIVNKDQLRILISRDGNIYDPTGAKPFINLSHWSVHVHNLRTKCVSVGVIWELSGLSYVPVSVNYIDVPKNSSVIVGKLKELSTLYFDFYYVQKGFGRVKNIVTKDCV